MFVGIISDLHSNLESLRLAFKICDEYQVEQIICAGDIVGYYTEPIKCLELLRERPEHSVVGNHDAIAITDNFKSEIRYFNDIARQSLVWTRNILRKHPDHWEYLRNLPLTKKVTIDGVNFFIAHSTPLNPEDWDYFYYFGVSDQDNELTNWLDMFNADVMIMGHTHVPFIYQTDEQKPRTVLNPGSTGQPRDGDSRASFMLFDTKKREVQHLRYKYDITTVCKGIKANKLHKYLCDRLYRGR